MIASANPREGRTCIVCGKNITVHEQARGGVCLSQKCQRKAVVRHLQERARKTLAAMRVLVAAHHQKTARRLGLPPKELPFARVPALERRTVKLPTRRKRQFRGRLLKLIKQAFELEKDQRPAKPSLDECELTPEPSLFQAGCATCRGHCCRLGAPLAFLETTTLRRFMARNPKLGPRDLLRLYLSKIPKATVEYSCLYHSEQGCVLPRMMRASICNTYHCEGLKALENKALEAGSNSILIVAATENKVVRSVVYNGAGQERRFGHYPEQKPALTP